MKVPAAQMEMSVVGRGKEGGRRGEGGGGSRGAAVVTRSQETRAQEGG